ATAILTGLPSATAGATGTPTSGPLPSASSTPFGPSVTPTTPRATPTVCVIRFSDVADATAYFYAPVYYLACRGVISGYSDGTFRPYNNTTRGQMAKIVVLAYALPPVAPPLEGARTFSDVTPDNVFYGLIETAAARGIISGYTCGGRNPQSGTAEPCDAAQRPYYRPGNNVTRGQLTKIVVIGAGWAIQTPATATFNDVAAANVFYGFIETAVCHGIISGYDDHTFRPNNAATRGQIAKIVYGALISPATCGP
ncbi:MAG: S-layer homology domain-containing protein, partial [Chloroflexota bacterium]|nr:S-layer homology domain-containing protein [Chloroflexota bacterium]